MKDYLVVDEKGIKEVHCMVCGIMIRERRQLFDEYGQPIRGLEILRTFANYAFNAEFNLEADGKPHSVAPAVLCKDCNDKEINLTQIMKQVRRGWIMEMKNMPFKRRAKALQQYSKVKIHSHIRNNGRGRNGELVI